MPSRPPWPWLRTVLVGLALLTSPWAAAQDHRAIGDRLRYIMPLAVIGLEAWRGDQEGLQQFGATWATTLVATEVFKRSLHVTRPDGSDNQSWPSGHAAHAFAAAAFVHQRHGMAAAWPAYLAATYVGWTRVEARRHRWIDIVGSAALATLASRAWVTPAQANGWVMHPHLEHHSIGVAWQRDW